MHVTIEQLLNTRWGLLASLEKTLAVSLTKDSDALQMGQLYLLCRTQAEAAVLAEGTQMYSVCI